MADLSTHARTSPRILPLEDATRRRRPPPMDGTAGPPSVDQLVRTMHTLKAARFNAAERLERKQLVSVVALSVVSLYFVGLSVWQAVYAASLSDAANPAVHAGSLMA